MPKLPRILNTLPLQHLEKLPSRLLRLHSLLYLRPSRTKNIRPDNPRMQYRDHHPFVSQLNRQILTNLVQRRLGRSVAITSSRGIIRDGAHPARHKAQARRSRGGLEDVGQQGLDKEQWAKGIHGEDARERGAGYGGQGVAVGRVHDPGDVEQEVEGLIVVIEVRVLEFLDGF